MNTTVQKELKRDIKRASRAMGIAEQELAERAMRFYLASIKEEVALRDELDAWERASDEALDTMEEAFRQV